MSIKKAERIKKSFIVSETVEVKTNEDKQGGMKNKKSVV